MGELYLSYAGFVKYVSEYGYKIEKFGESILSVWLNEKKAHLFSVSIDKDQKDCGFIYTNTYDLEQIFEDNRELQQILITECIKPRPNVPKMASHCCIDPDLWGKMETIIHSGEKIHCLRTGF
jgi:hypothetical protein